MVAECASLEHVSVPEQVENLVEVIVTMYLRAEQLIFLEALTVGRIDRVVDGQLNQLTRFLQVLFVKWVTKVGREEAKHVENPKNCQSSSKRMSMVSSPKLWFTTLGNVVE